MRYRFSLWDPLVVLGVVTEVWSGVRLADRLEGPVPLHWGFDGTPDRFGDPSLLALLFGAGLAVLIFGLLRLIDAAHASRGEPYAGFLTDLGGGLAVFMLLLGGLVQWSTAHPEMTVTPLPLLGSMLAFVGWRLVRAEDAPLNTGDLFPDTAETRARLKDGLGRGLLLTGALAFALAWLPGPWAAVSLVALIVGPLVCLGLAFSRVGTV